VRILLDENIPIQLKPLLPGNVVKSVNDKDIGWKTVKNGKLLSQMEGSYDLLITADKNMYAQQNLSDSTLSILVLPTNRRSVVLDLAVRILEIVAALSPREYAVLDSAGIASKREFGEPDGGSSGPTP
jgi:predicted nuclease of predicted toxin-antitoxin system